MNLVEGELIEEIEQVDEGWWAGVGDGGAKRGLFPGECYVASVIGDPISLHFASFSASSHLPLCCRSPICAGKPDAPIVGSRLSRRGT